MGPEPSDPTAPADLPPAALDRAVSPQRAVPDGPVPERAVPDGVVRRSVARCWVAWHSSAASARPFDHAGQSTVEYALVLLGAAAVALALVAWVTRSDAVSRLFDSIVGRILSQAG